MIKSFLYIVLLCFVTESYSQILIDKSIRNISGDTLTIKNLGSPSDSTMLPPLNYIRNNSPLFVSGNFSNDTLYASIDTTLFQIKNGLVIMLTSNQANTNNTILKLNSFSYSIKKTNKSTLSPGDIIPEKIMILVLDSNQFIYLNPERSICPTGYTKVNDKYCIETDERQANFWTAMTTCLTEGSRLCSWSEWYYACRHSDALGIQNMKNLNWEWIHQSQNEVFQGKAVGRNRCDITIHRDGVNLDYFRCCYDF